ncbi:ankyrin repeat domain-containing protein [Aspergillus foveolatus]|uniref:ankyrin repeat domain-containing protein n=1 Tax=Aspergillus foveolatus TaxID=210207 RepID=UPI003CCCBED5
MSPVRTQPLAEVVWWTDKQFCVRCPYCEELHRHGLISSSNASTVVSRDYPRTSRVPHCAFATTRPPYECSFPVEYEIDKPKARFVNIRTLSDLRDDEKEESDDEASLTSLLSNLALTDTKEVSFDHSTEEITIQMEGQEPFTQRRILHATSDCCMGNVERVKHYLETSPDKPIFLHGKDTNGDTCLITASRERTPAMVSLLLENGAEVNASNYNGRTALMEAALWGRLETVKILLSHGANKTLRDRNKKKELSTLLYQPVRIARRGTQPQAEHWVIPRKNPSTRRMSSIETQTDEKLRGLLREGSLGVEQIIMPECSSWTEISFEGLLMICRFPITPCRGHEKLLLYWKETGIFLPKFYASHTEKQLIAYFIDRHVFLQEDRTQNPQFYNKIEHLEHEISAMVDRYPDVRKFYQLRKDKKELDLQLFDKDDRLLGDEYDEGLVKQLKEKVATIDRKLVTLKGQREVVQLLKKEKEIQKCEDNWKIHERLNRLSDKAPTNALKRATILITAPSYRVCDDCREFNRRVNKDLGLSIQLYERTQHH